MSSTSSRQPPFSAATAAGEIDDLALRRLEALLDQEATIEDRLALIGDARRLRRHQRLTGGHRVDVDRRPTGLGGNHRHVGAPPRQRRTQLGAQPLEEAPERVDRARAQERHAAVRDLAARAHAAPVDAAMPDADAIDAERLGDDDVIGPRRRDPPGLGQPADAGEAAALLVDGAAHLDGAAERRAGAPQRLGGDHRGGEPRLHVGGAATVEQPVADHAAERLDRPAVAGRHHVEVAVEMDARPGGLAAPRAEHVPARIPRHRRRGRDAAARPRSRSRATDPPADRRTRGRARPAD